MGNILCNIDYDTDNNNINMNDNKKWTINHQKDFDCHDIQCLYYKKKSNACGIKKIKSICFLIF